MLSDHLDDAFLLNNFEMWYDDSYLHNCIFKRTNCTKSIILKTQFCNFKIMTLTYTIRVSVINYSKSTVTRPATKYFFTAVYGGLQVQVRLLFFSFSFFFFKTKVSSSDSTEPFGLKFWLWVPINQTNFFPFMSHDDSMTLSES